MGIGQRLGHLAADPRDRPACRDVRAGAGRGHRTGPPGSIRLGRARGRGSVGSPGRGTGRPGPGLSAGRASAVARHRRIGPSPAAGFRPGGDAGVADDRVEAAARDELHRVVPDLALLADVVDRHDVRVLEPGRGRASRRNRSGPWRPPRPARPGPSARPDGPARPARPRRRRPSRPGPARGRSGSRPAGGAGARWLARGHAAARRDRSSCSIWARVGKRSRISPAKRIPLGVLGRVRPVAGPAGLGELLGEPVQEVDLLGLGRGHGCGLRGVASRAGSGETRSREDFTVPLNSIVTGRHQEGCIGRPWWCPEARFRAVGPGHHTLPGGPGPVKVDGRSTTSRRDGSFGARPLKGDSSETLVLIDRARWGDPDVIGTLLDRHRPPPPADGRIPPGLRGSGGGPTPRTSSRTPSWSPPRGWTASSGIPSSLPSCGPARSSANAWRRSIATISGCRWATSKTTS